MAIWYRVLELTDAEGKPSGTYRLTSASDESTAPPLGLCGHRHSTRAEARACPDAKAQLPPEIRRQRLTDTRAVIGDSCRAERGDDGALEETLRRVEESLRALLDVWPVGARTEIHVTVDVEHEP